MSYNVLRGFPYVVIPFDISPPTAGDTQIMALVAEKHLVVAKLVLVTHGDVVAAFFSGDSTTAGNSISGALTGDQIHGIVHSVAFADYSAGWLPFHETPRAAFLQATQKAPCFSEFPVTN